MSGYQLMRQAFRDADARCFITPQSVWKKDETFYVCERYARNYVKEYIEVETDEIQRDDKEDPGQLW